MKVRTRCSETRYEGKQSEDCHGFHASALLVLQISLRRSAMRRFYYVGRHIAIAMMFFTVFDRFRAPRSIEASASVDSGRKNDVRFLYRNVRRASKKLFGPRKPRCVDFIRQTYSKRYDFFDRFRSFSSTAIDRGIGIGRFSVEKTTFDFFKKT